ncbi:MAG: ribonuclease P protein component [Defluviitaleaceae bacterium]|nr:ribonuclease P protein component [Defluviitaleaceae bacterium]
MKKAYRMKKSADIELVMKKGFSKANRTFIVYQYKNPMGKGYRVAISAPKKLGKAVARNKVKRQMRVILQQNSHLLKEGFDYFIIARPNVLEIDFLTLIKQMKHVLRLVHQQPEKKVKKNK